MIRLGALTYAAVSTVPERVFSNAYETTQANMACLLDEIIPVRRATRSRTL